MNLRLRRETGELIDSTGHCVASGVLWFGEGDAAEAAVAWMERPVSAETAAKLDALRVAVVTAEGMPEAWFSCVEVPQ